MRHWLPVLALAGILAAGACAPEVVRENTAMIPSTEPGSVMTLAADVPIRVTWYDRVLEKGSQWKKVGRVPAGDVYRKLNGVLTIEGAHVHEAYIVERHGLLVGFYLPGEHAFSPISPAPQLPHNKRE